MVVGMPQMGMTEMVVGMIEMLTMSVKLGSDSDMLKMAFILYLASHEPHFTSPAMNLTMPRQP